MNDWIIAFEKAIEKRIKTSKNIFITLSSGYDSGCLDLVLKKKISNLNHILLKLKKKLKQ